MDNRTASTPAATLQPAAVAPDAERSGFHSMVLDHVCMPMQTGSAHVANVTGKLLPTPPRPARRRRGHGAVATVTTTLKLGTSVLVAPYRGPLQDISQFTTVDVLSNGRLLLGVGEGWMAEEFTAGHRPAEKGRRTVECIEIYKRCWLDDVVSFDGEFHRFAELSMDPKPVQRPHPPIIYGGVSPLGARRAARRCDGFYPLFLDPFAEPARYRSHQDEIRRVLDEIGRDPATFTMMGAATVHLTDRDGSGDGAAGRSPDGRRMICTGRPADVVEDLARFAAEGYSLLVLKVVCPSGDVSELRDTIARIGEEVIPAAAGLVPAGGWQPSL
ncbi:MAG: TIGR03619 family F420-dependent LLM class oxidoreductase [Acidimicrobiales bacterium]